MSAKAAYLLELVGKRVEELTLAEWRFLKAELSREPHPAHVTVAEALEAIAKGAERS